MTTPGRDARRVEQAFGTDYIDGGLMKAVCKLLQAERARLRRTIQKQRACYVCARQESEREIKRGKGDPADVTHISAMIEALDDLLAVLARGKTR